MPGFLAELGVTTNLLQRDAGLALARFVAQAIVDGRVKPYEGARLIWKEIVRELGANPPQELMSFVGNASEYEDREYHTQNPEEVCRKIADDIIEDAHKLAGNANQS
jgi:hypothetical protein